jgi:thiamine-monophosphate kinase
MAKNGVVSSNGDMERHHGLKVLEREKNSVSGKPIRNQIWYYTYLIERQLKPEARKDVRTLFHALEIKPTSMISDGLSSDYAFV